MGCHAFTIGPNGRRRIVPHSNMHGCVWKNAFTFIYVSFTLVPDFRFETTSKSSNNIHSNINIMYSFVRCPFQSDMKLLGKRKVSYS